MDDVTRRETLRLGAAAGLGMVGSSLAQSAEQEKKKTDENSGATALQRTVTECKIDVGKVEAKKAEAMGCFFGRMSPDPSPGRNILTISGLPTGTRGISAWVTEWTPGGPHAGGAFFYTHSVQLYDNGTKCRVVFDLEWGTHLPGGAQVIYC